MPIKSKAQRRKLPERLHPKPVVRRKRKVKSKHAPKSKAARAKRKGRRPAKK